MIRKKKGRAKQGAILLRTIGRPTSLAIPAIQCRPGLAECERCRAQINGSSSGLDLRQAEMWAEAYASDSDAQAVPMTTEQLQHLEEKLSRVDRLCESARCPVAFESFLLLWRFGVGVRNFRRAV
jgi:hypothetical protein